MSAPSTIALKAGGKRDVRVTVDEGKAIAARFAQEIKDHPNATVETVDLSCRCWKRESMEPLQDVMASIVHQVKRLKLDDIIASLDTDDGLDTLGLVATMFGASRTLEHVNLDDNALGSRGDQVLLPLFSLPTLQELSLENCGMSLEVAESLLNSLHSSNSDNNNNPQRHLTLLSMGRNQIGAQGAAHVGTILGQCPNLRVVRYNGARPLTEGTAALVQGLAQAGDGAQLTHLDMHDCTLKAPSEREDIWQNLMTILNRSPHLEVLNLRDTEMTNEGLVQVLDYVRDKQVRLTSLSLGGCELGQEGAETLRDAVEQGVFAKLEVLNLDTNELENDGVATLLPSLAAHCPVLKSLDLECNDLGEEAVDVLCNDENKLGALTELNLSDNMDLDDDDLNERLKEVYAFCKVDGDEERKKPAPAIPEQVQVAEEAAVEELAEELEKNL